MATISMSRVPSAAEINALPEATRNYIHDLETRADPTWDLRRAHAAEENAQCLHALVLEMEAKNLRFWTALRLIAVLVWVFGGIGTAVFWLQLKQGSWLGVLWLVGLVLIVHLESKRARC